MHEKDGNSRSCAEDCVCIRQKKTQSEINALMGGRNCNDSSSQFENTTVFLLILHVVVLTPQIILVLIVVLLLLLFICMKFYLLV